MVIAEQPDNADSSISLYIHVPFCTKKCAYCHFFVLPDRTNDKQKFLTALEQEWELLKPLIIGKQVTSLYFGGGTPSLLAPETIHHLIQTISQKVRFTTQPEITLEANPENITPDKMLGFYQAGINRISMGVQTLNDDLLLQLGREHSGQKALEAIQIIRQSGIQNLSVDLMYDLPYQDLTIWSETLDRISHEPITHLSLYNLTIEPHTLFFKNRATLQRHLPDEEASLQMYEMAIEKLHKQGLEQYEISAFAKPGFYSKHNTGYWTARNFIGLGPSAFSYWQGKRYRNVANLNKYCEALAKKQLPIDFEETLDPDAKRRELLAIQLRLCEGVRLSHFERRHGLLGPHVNNTLHTLAHQGLLKLEQDHVSLTKKGILFYDTVATDIV